MCNSDGREPWETFRATGVVPERMRVEIAESWRRSRAHGVDPENPAPTVLTEAELVKKLRENQELLQFSGEVMQNTRILAGNTQNLVSLHDRDGYLLDYIYNIPTDGRRERTKFQKGAKWDEASVGTNGVGLVLVLDRPVQVIGDEHYCPTQHYATCSAAPIHDEHGNIIGVLNMSGEKAGSTPHTLGLVASGAFAVEKQLALYRSYSVINNTLEAVSEGLIILDDSLNILMLSRHACKLLDTDRDTLRGQNIESLFCPSDFKDKIYIGKRPFSYLEGDFKLSGRIMTLHVSATPMLNNGRVTGVILLLQELQAINRVANQVSGNKARYDFKDIITKDTRMLAIIETMKEIAVTDCTVLIEGESGTGKELFAHSIHNYSGRRRGPFIAINCASLPRSLVESELFGYEKGAFTGASSQGNQGKFELANGGSIFLDEIGELPLEIQAKLLRVLDTHRVSRIGGRAEKELDVRVIAATNRDLLDEVERGNFRADLYYRINVLSFGIPPLRGRPGDVLLLAESFLNSLNDKGEELSPRLLPKRFDPALLERLERYGWPGNVRELQNAIVRAYYASGAREQVKLCDLPDTILKGPAVPPQSEQAVFDAADRCTDEAPQTEKDAILAALKSHEANVVKAGRSLNMSKATIYRKIKNYGIDLCMIRRSISS